MCVKYLYIILLHGKSCKTNEKSEARHETRVSNSKIDVCDIVKSANRIVECDAVLINVQYNY